MLYKTPESAPEGKSRKSTARELIFSMQVLSFVLFLCTIAAPAVKDGKQEYKCTDPIMCKRAE
jgi:hypothetical protein